VRILVFGGSVFLSREVAVEAVRRGHEVVCACRGSAPLPDGASHAPLDRATQEPASVLDGSFDAVVDLARHPSWVRRAVAALPDPHWVFVSTISVYADHTTPEGRPETLPVLTPVTTDEDLTENPEAYGAMKVGCEQSVREAVDAVVVRPGLIVGPGDPTGRFTYWPTRLAAEGPVLAPGHPDDPTQVVDVRDLAAWIVDAAEQRLTGVFDAIGPVIPRGPFLEEVAEGVGSSPELVWFPDERLVELGVEPWAGPGSVPLWLPGKEHAGMAAHDPGPASDAGLTSRPLAETARDTLAWFRATETAVLTGISRDREAALLAAGPTAGTG
jgi:2'-hydroxyisoflavone reductase